MLYNLVQYCTTMHIVSEDGAAWQGRLRQRKPKRTDKELVAIYDGFG